MIEKMRRYSFFVFEPEYQDFLLKIRAFGVLHIKEQRNPKEEARFRENLEKQAEVKNLQTRFEKLRSERKAEVPSTSAPKEQASSALLTNYQALTESVATSTHRIEELRATLEQTKEQLRQVAPWGYFEQNTLQKLSDAGYHLHFWQLPRQFYTEEWQAEHPSYLVGETQRHQLLVTVDESEHPTPLTGAELVQLPSRDLKELTAEEERLNKEIAEQEQHLLYLATQEQATAPELIRLQNEYNLGNAQYQGNRLFDDKLVILEGWVPDKLANKLEQQLTADGDAFVELEITDADTDVPIQLSNSRFARVFEPIVHMFSLPNYHELDPTPYIAPFFLLFFGICFGDAGYGLLVLLLCTFLKRKAKENTKPLLELCQWLGLAGLVIGFFSGSFFGISLVEVPFLVAIKSYFISSENMMVISVAIGFVHVVFGKYIAAAKKHKQQGLKMALASYAWPTILMLVGLMLLLPQANITLPSWLEYLLLGVVAVSVLLVVFYNSPGKNIFVNVASSIWDSYNTASGLLGDVLSYIRLFAIGLTGAVLGQVFNNLAISMTADLPTVAAIPIAVIILLLGHGINFGLTTIGALVHPIRLIFVEYFNNSDYEGGGTEYNPLRELTQEIDK